MKTAEPIVGQRELITTDLPINFLIMLSKFSDKVGKHFKDFKKWFDDHTLIACAARLPKWVIPRTLNSRHLEKLREKKHEF